MSRIWLINPPMQKKEMFARGSEATASINPPLGLAYIAAYLVKYGHECEILDGAVTPIALEEILRRSETFDIIGITVVTAYYLRVRELIQLLTSKDQRPPILVGGPHVTALPESMLEDGADISIVGEGEESIREVVELFETNKQTNKQLAARSQEDQRYRV